jgi:hypothetical protein
VAFAQSVISAPPCSGNITEIRLAPTVVGQVPIGYVTDAVTGASWEGSGVAPHVECPASEAVPAALAHGVK